MKVDLDELERKARVADVAHPTKTWLWTGDQLDAYTDAFRPPVTLALIARIRELELSVKWAAEMVAMGSSDRALLLSVLDRGTVLP